MSKSVVACHVMRKPLRQIVYCTTFPATIMPKISHLYLYVCREYCDCLVFARHVGGAVYLQAPIVLLYDEPSLGASHLGPSQRLQG